MLESPLFPSCSKQLCTHLAERQDGSKFTFWLITSAGDCSRDEWHIPSHVLHTHSSLPCDSLKTYWITRGNFNKKKDYRGLLLDFDVLQMWLKCTLSWVALTERVCWFRLMFLVMFKSIACQWNVTAEKVDPKSLWFKGCFFCFVFFYHNHPVTERLKVLYAVSHTH